MEEYVLDALVTSVESVVPGLGPLAGMLAGLAGGLTGPGSAGMSLDAMELLVMARGRELLRAVLQHGLDAQAAAEVRVPEVTGADGITRTRAERGHARTVVTTAGKVTVRRIGYRSDAAGVPALFPRDAVLNLPPRRYSWQVQRLAVMSARDGAYELAREFVAAATGITIGKRQLEQIVAGAAAGVAAFYAGPALARPGQPPSPAGQPGQQRPGRPEQEKPLPLALSADGKGVAMRPESRRTRTKAPDQRVKNFTTRPGIGEKGHKRIAETACVFDVIPQPRTPEQVMASHHGGGRTGKAQDKPAPRRSAAATGWISPRTGPRRSAGCLMRPGTAIPDMPGTGSPWSTGITTRSA